MTFASVSQFLVYLPWVNAQPTFVSSSSLLPVVAANDEYSSILFYVSVWKMVRYVIFALNALCLPSVTPLDPCLHACEDERMEHRSTRRVGIKYALIQQWELTMMFSTVQTAIWNHCRLTQIFNFVFSLQQFVHVCIQGLLS